LFYIFDKWNQSKNIISDDPDTLNGQPVFQGTLVSIESLLMHLEKGVSFDDFPTITKVQVIDVLELAQKMFQSKNPDRLNEIAA